MKLIESHPFYLQLIDKAENFSNNKSKNHFDNWMSLKSSESFNSNSNDQDMLRILFASETLYIIIIKTLVCSLIKNRSGITNELFYYDIGNDKFYEEQNIRNFRAPDYYDWWIDENCDESSLSNLLQLIKEIGDAHLSADEDILKIIYQTILSKSNRYRTGQYYTPDWLVEYVIEASGYHGLPGETLLDPSCGSGSFLFFAVKKILSQTGKENILPSQILNNLHGFDLNPLAVITTKANLIIALNRFLPFTEDIYFNIEKKDLLDSDSSILNNGFDFILGNPPWVNWKSMSEAYKQKIIPAAKIYGLFNQKGLKARLGFAEDDISSILTYISIDRYLKHHGTLAFILPQSLFQSIGGGEGFRKFYLSNSETGISVSKVVDFVKISPFKSASNRAALLVAVKGVKNSYPVKYDIVVKNDSGMNTYKNLEEFRKKTETKSNFAEPVDEKNIQSPWILTPDKNLLQLLRNLMIESHYKARAGVCTWMSGVYWVDILQREKEYFLISNNPEYGKIKIKQIMRNVDSFLVYPLLRGRDIQRWSSNYSGNIIFAQSAHNPAKAIPEEEMKLKYKLTYDYFSEFKDLLLERKGYKKLLFKQPFYAVYDVGSYTIAPYKVGWKYLSKTMDAAVIENNNEKTIIPDLNVISIAAESNLEAYYISALLNSSIVQVIVRTYGECLRITPGIMKQLPISKYDDSKHKRLAELAGDAHRNFNNPAKVKEIEEEIDEIYSYILGLSSFDLKRIKDYLNESE